jgi:hypothetical protein
MQVVPNIYQFASVREFQKWGKQISRVWLSPELVSSALDIEYAG